MDDISLTSGIVIVVLVVIDALITLGYAALGDADDDKSLNDTVNLKRRVALGGQIGLILVRFGMVALAVQGISLPLTRVYPTLSPVVLYAAVLLPLALIVLVLGEVVPAMVGKTYANQLAPALRTPFTIMTTLLAPLIWLVSSLSGLLLLPFGIKEGNSSVTEEQFLKLVENEELLEAEERKMIHSVMQLDQTSVTEMMVPRMDIVAVERRTSITEARQNFLESGHSRMPVYEGSIDHVVGMVYVKDLLEVWHNGDTVVEAVEEIKRPAHFVPEAMKGDQLLHFFQRNKVHMVIVLEEYGGTGGLVTLEDLLEEIVGDIQDEYDEDEFEDIMMVSASEYRVDAGVSLFDLNEATGLKLEKDEVDTLGGYIFQMLDRVPELNEVILTEAVELKVLSLEGRRIREVYVRVLEADESDERRKRIDESESRELLDMTDSSSDASGATGIPVPSPQAE